MGYIYTVLLGHPVQNICFASIKKSSYKNEYFHSFNKKKLFTVLEPP